jgi:hypothetical protein
MFGLHPEKFIECVRIESRDWTPAMFRKVWSKLGPKERAFCEIIVNGSNDTLEEIREKMKLKYALEVEGVIRDLQLKLWKMGINPQEVYAVDLSVETHGPDAGTLIAHYYATCTFQSIHEQVIYPEQYKEANEPIKLVSA